MVEIMKDNKVIDNELVEVFHAEDSIFNNCMNDFEEFPSYITGYDDIEEYYPKKHALNVFNSSKIEIFCNS